MDERIRFIKHQGKLVLLVDCSHCSAEEIEKLSRLVPTYVTAQPLESVLLLADFTGATFDRSAVTIMKEGMVFDRPYIKKSAWIGTETLPHVFYENMKSFSQRDSPTFATREEALEWLVLD